MSDNAEVRRWFYIGERATRELGADVTRLLADLKAKGLDRSGIVTKAVYREGAAALDRLIDARWGEIAAMTDKLPAQRALEAFAADASNRIMAHSYYCAGSHPETDQGQIRASGALAEMLCDRVALLFEEAGITKRPDSAQAEPAAQSTPLNRKMKDDAWAALLSGLNDDGIVKRALKVEHVDKNWLKAAGQRPSVEAVRASMKNAPKGRPSSEK